MWGSLIPCDWGPYKKGGEDTDAHRGMTTEDTGEGGVHAQERGLGRSQPAHPGYRTSSLQDWAVMNTCYLNHQTASSAALGQWM